MSQLKVIYGDNSYNAYENAKSFSLEVNGFRHRIKKEGVRISRESYWDIGRWDAQFETADLHCKLCDTHSGVSFGCNCPEKGFTIEEHNNNLIKLKN